jgi:hypothetical protein
MIAIARGLHLNDHYFFDRFTGNPTRLFRIFNYPAGGKGKGAGVGEHTDYGLLTLLYQDEVGGLQVKHRDTWIDAPYVPGSFVTEQSVKSVSRSGPTAPVSITSKWRADIRKKLARARVLRMRKEVFGRGPLED